MGLGSMLVLGMLMAVLVLDIGRRVSSVKAPKSCNDGSSMRRTRRDGRSVRSEPSLDSNEDVQRCPKSKGNSVALVLEFLLAVQFQAMGDHHNFAYLRVKDFGKVFVARIHP